MAYIDANRACYQKDYSMVNLHSHPHYEIYYLVSGNRQFFLSNKMYNLTGPTAIIIPPYTPHKTEGGPFERYNVNVSPSYLNPFQKEILETKSFLAILPSGKQNEEFVHVLSQLVNVRNHAFKTYATDAIFSYFVYLLEQAHNNTIPHVTSNEIKTSPTILKAISYLNKHYSERITLADLSSKFNISKATLNYSFKNATSCTPMDYLLNIRLAKAKKLLVETQKSIQEISSECGFSSPNYFGVIFKKRETISPAT